MDRRGLFNKILYIIVFSSIFTLVPISIEYLKLSGIEREDVFNYEATIIRAGGVDTEEKTIQIYSYAEFYLPSLIRYKDILYCRPDQESPFEFVDSNETSRQVKPMTLPKVEITKDGERIEVPWRFSYDANLKDGEQCKIESTITSIMRFDIPHSQTIISNIFTVE